MKYVLLQYDPLVGCFVLRGPGTGAGCIFYPHHIIYLQSGTQGDLQSCLVEPRRVAERTYRCILVYWGSNKHTQVSFNPGGSIPHNKGIRAPWVAEGLWLTVLFFSRQDTASRLLDLRQTGNPSKCCFLIFGGPLFLYIRSWLACLVVLCFLVCFRVGCTFIYVGGRGKGRRGALTAAVPNMRALSRVCWLDVCLF